jgi:predicted transcriptional regulator
MKEKLEELRKQQEMAKELFVKCQGAIELLQSMIEEEKEKKNGKEKDDKKV